MIIGCCGCLIFKIAWSCSTIISLSLVIIMMIILFSVVALTTFNFPFIFDKLGYINLSHTVFAITFVLGAWSFIVILNHLWFDLCDTKLWYMLIFFQIFWVLLIFVCICCVYCANILFFLIIFFIFNGYLRFIINIFLNLWWEHV